MSIMVGIDWETVLVRHFGELLPCIADCIAGHDPIYRVLTFAVRSIQ